MAFQVTPAHERIFQALLQGKGNLAIQARAGCGKTSTIVEMIRRLPPSTTVAYTSFAAKNIEDVKEKFDALNRPFGLHYRTMHSFGSQAIRKRFGKVMVDKDKPRKLLERLTNEDTFKIFMGPVLKLVDRAMSVGEVSMELVERFDLDPPDGDDALWTQALDLANQVIAASLRDLSRISFGDMLYAPVKLNLKMEQFDVVFVDEAQDLSSVQREMVKKMVKEGGRVIAVGDDRQAIYAFRGADSESFSLIVEQFGMEVLPMTTSYRCPKAVAVEANLYVQDFQVTESNPEGVVRDETFSPTTIKSFLPTDLVVCRMNAPLVKMAYHLFREGLPCRVLGRDLGAGLIALVDKLKARDLPSLVEKLSKWEEKELLKFKKDEAKRAAVSDKADTLRVFLDECQTVAEVRRKIEELFTDFNERGRLTLATVHKVKGAEAERVFILAPHLLPGPFAKTQEQKVQEENLAYVAVTRAKQELVYLSWDALK